MRNIHLPLIVFKSILVLFFFSLESCKNDTPKNKADQINATEESENEQLNHSEIMIFDEFEDYASLRTINELQNAFGTGNCKNGISHYAEGTIEVKHTIVKNLKNNHHVKYVWNQKDPSKLDFIEASYYIYDSEFNILGRQTIESNCGIKLGMKLNDLRAWNEKDFEFAGFDWDYEGTVMGTDNSKLDQCKVKLKLGINDKSNSETFSSLSSDNLFNTSNELVKKAPIFVAFFTYYIPKGSKDK